MILNELVLKKELVRILQVQVYRTYEEKHGTDFNYVLKVKVAGASYPLEYVEITLVNAQNGNDTFSPHSSKIVVI